MKKILLIILLILILIIPMVVEKRLMERIEDTIEEKEVLCICIDPGHGGIDGGAMSRNGIYEKDINLKVSYFLKKYLEDCGINVFLTRTEDYDLASENSKNRKKEDINKRIEMIEKSNCFLYVSIHCNIYQDNKIYGAQTFYNSSNEENKILAEAIQDKIKSILKNTNRVAKSITGKYLMDNTKTTGCLVEIGFLSNEKELNLLCDSEYQDEIAYCIYIGILDFIGAKDKI